MCFGNLIEVYRAAQIFTASYNQILGGNMPYINLRITTGANREQKKLIVEQFTKTLVDVLDKKPEHIHIVIDEIDEDNWGFKGMLTSDFKR